jgi:glycosyltransferase involved in cell wall biosynthesis
MKFTLIIPTLNEVGGAREIMPRIKRDWVDQILVVDGGSIDGTIEYFTQCGFTVLRQGKKGMRYAYYQALPFVTGDCIITFSPDGNCIPEIIPVLAEKMREGYDMVIASRYAQGAKSYDDDLLTAFGNRLFTSTINLLYGSSYTDGMGIFRAYKKSLVYDLGLDKDQNYAGWEKIFNTTLSWEPLLSAQAAKNKLKFLDIPADEPKRIHGRRKLQLWRWGAAYYCQIIGKAWR